MITLTKKQLADAAGYTSRRLRDIDNALPEGHKLFEQAEDGKYSLSAFVRNWVEYNVNKDDTAGKTLEEVKAEHEVVKKRKTELEVQEMEGRLVDVNLVQRLWANVAHTIMQNMIRLPSKIAVQVQMMQSTDAISAIIDAEIRTVLNALAETPLPDAARETDEDNDEENGI